MLAQHEDNGSESSGETATYDSGRGGSESDIQTSMSQSHDNGKIISELLQKMSWVCLSSRYRPLIR